MSAVVCGKRSFFEDMDSAAASPVSASPPVYKKMRCSSATSPVRFNCALPVHPSPVDQLKALFPDREIELLEKALEETGNNLDSAIDNLNGVCFRDSICSPGLPVDENTNMEKDLLKEPQLQNHPSGDGAEWVDLLVREMMTATSIDDARTRAACVLESLEKSINSRASSDAAEGFREENLMLKGQIEMVLRDNTILKRAVAIQHECHKEYDEKNQEVLQLKQLVAQYQEQLRTLEVNNYALMMHLRQAQQSNSIPGHFHPDIF